MMKEVDQVLVIKNPAEYSGVYSTNTITSFKNKNNTINY